MTKYRKTQESFDDHCKKGAEFLAETTMARIGLSRYLAEENKKFKKELLESLNRPFKNELVQ